MKSDLLASVGTVGAMLRSLRQVIDYVSTLSPYNWSAGSFCTNGGETNWLSSVGGPTTYSDSYGEETTVVKMVSGNGEHDEMDRRAIACFDQALADED